MFWEEEGGSTNLSFSNGFTYMNILKHIFVIIYSRLYCFYYVILISNDTLKIREHLFLISIKYNSIKIERSGKYLISLFLTSSLFWFECKEFWIIILLIVCILGKSKHLIKKAYADFRSRSEMMIKKCSTEKILAPKIRTEFQFFSFVYFNQI